MCIEENGKLSAGDICIGEECAIKFGKIESPCNGKEIQGDFHTHPYLADVKKEFGLIHMKPSKELMKSAIDAFLKERKLSPTMPSYGDTITAILGKCAKKIKGSVCIGSDLDENKVECWTTKDIDEGDCIKTVVEHFEPEHIPSKPPEDWIKPLFDKEIIKLK